MRSNDASLEVAVARGSTLQEGWSVQARDGSIDLRLPPGFRAVFNLYILEGYSHPEIADILGISVGTSKSQLLRAKSHFKKLLESSLTY